jgi:hypothetical protein
MDRNRKKIGNFGFVSAVPIRMQLRRIAHDALARYVSVCINALA